MITKASSPTFRATHEALKKELAKRHSLKSIKGPEKNPKRLTVSEKENPLRQKSPHLNQRSNTLKLQLSSPKNASQLQSPSNKIQLQSPTAKFSTIQVNGRLLSTKNANILSPSHAFSRNTPTSQAKSATMNHRYSSTQTRSNISFVIGQTEPSVEDTDEATFRLKTEPDSRSNRRDASPLFINELSQEECQRKWQIETFLERLGKIRNESECYSQQLTNKEVEIKSYYNSQIENVTYAFIMLEKFLNDEKNSLLIKLNKAMSQTLEAVEKTRADLGSHTAELDKANFDIQSNFFNIVKKMPNAPFHDILSQYNDLLSTVSRKINSDLLLQKVRLLEAKEQPATIETLQKDLANVFRLSHAQIDLLLPRVVDQFVPGQPREDPAILHESEAYENTRRSSLPSLPEEYATVTPLGERCQNVNSQTTGHRKKLSELSTVKITDYKICYDSAEIYPDTENAAQAQDLVSVQPVRSPKVRDPLRNNKENETSALRDTTNMMSSPKHQFLQAKENEAINHVGPEEMKLHPSHSDKQLGQQLSDDNNQKDIFYLYVESKLRMNDNPSERLRHLLVQNLSSPKNASDPRSTLLAKSVELLHQ